MTRKCCEETRKRSKGEVALTEWEREKKNFFEDREFKIEKVEKEREREWRMGL